MGDSSPDNAPIFDPSTFDNSHPVGEDFYGYVNAHWQRENPIPAEYGSWGSFHEVHVRNEALLRELLDEAAASPAEPGSAARMAGDYWAAGLDEEAIEAAGLTPLAPYLDMVDEVGAATDLAGLAASLRNSGLGILFGSYVSPDFEDSSRHLLYVNQGGLGLPERDYYFRDDEHSTELLAAYEAHVARMLDLVGRDPDPAAAAGAIVALETRLAEVSLTPTELRDTELTTNKISRSEFAEAMPGFDLAHMLTAVIGDAPPSVNFDNPRFFSNYGPIIASLPIETLRAYLRWQLIRATASSLSSAFVEANFDFYGRLLGGQRELRARWKRVLGAASVDIGQQVSKLFVAAAFSRDAKERCEAMVEDLLAAMRDSINTLTWMSDETKAKALVKLDGFKYKIGYPDEWRDYTGLAIDRDSYLSNRLRAAAFELHRKLAKLDEPVDDKEWAMEPHAVNAYYHPLYNEIVFPAGILQPPFFRPDADDATNYGAIGAVIGHEITHGFDDQGSKFDDAGNLRNWWSEADRAAFDERAARLAKQYAEYEALDGLPVNGELTLGENIADLGGATIAFQALQRALERKKIPCSEPHGPDGLSPCQRFFVSFATMWRVNYTDEYVRLIVTSDPHSPGQFRCNGVLANFPAFAEAFDLGETASLATREDELIKIW